MKKALISPNEPSSTGHRICDIEDNSFDVAEPLFWIDVSDEVTQNYFYNPETKQAEPIPVIAKAAENQPATSGMMKI
jgi:hypothetical protein